MAVVVLAHCVAAPEQSVAREEVDDEVDPVRVDYAGEAPAELPVEQCAEQHGGADASGLSGECHPSDLLVLPVNQVHLSHVLEVGEACRYPDILSAESNHFLVQTHEFEERPSESTGDQKDAEEDGGHEHCLVPVHLAHPVVFLAVGMRDQRARTVLDEFDAC